MRKSILAAASCLMLLLGAVSCGGGEQKADAPAKKKTEARSENLPNYRYVDLDSILTRYNLAKDYNEEMMRMQNNYDAEAKKHESSIQSKATQMQNKYQNNGYLSQASLEQDQKDLEAMQSRAQKTLGTMQQNFATAAEKAHKAVNDSIEAFIEDYNRKKGYDAIFFKAAALHFNPELDITDEVVEGLNARYNKKQK